VINLAFIKGSLMNKSILLMLVSLISVLVMACEAKVGSDTWCEEMSKKAKGDWTFNQTTDYAKHCILPKS